MPKFRCPDGFRQDPPKSKNCVKKEEESTRRPSNSSSKSKTVKKKRCPKGTRKNKDGICVPISIASIPKKEPTPKEPTPKEPTPKEPTPKEPTPKEPTPKEPTPKEPTPKEPTPKEPTPKEPTPKEPSPKKPETSLWTKVYSKKHNKWFWLNEKTGQKTWYDPMESNPHTENVYQKPFIAVIVPFRDLHAAQERKKHLDRFIPEISNFLSKSNKPFRVYIIEQSSDDRKFNRGKLLNIGFKMAKKDGAQIFIFHDVDLIPSANLLPYYTQIPRNPCHIARVWNRYSGNKAYFGGVVAFSAKQFETINGFPNNFWGWGGEDDELYLRVKETNMRIDFPREGTYVDMENMNLNAKLQFLRTNATLKCMNKQEVLAEHKSTWKTNGLNDLYYSVLNKTRLGKHGVKYEVDIQLNDHWTDQLCILNALTYGK